MKNLNRAGLLFICINVFWFAPNLYAEDDFFNNLKQHEAIRVERVISVDTIQLVNGEKVKLIGIKALPPPAKPETERDKFGFVIEKETPYFSIEEQAFDFIQNLVEDRYVRLEFDVQKKDEHFNTLAYVFLLKDDVFINALVLENGFAHLQTSPPNLKYAERLRSAYLEARKEKLGIHGNY